MENINIEDFKVKGEIKLDDFLTKLPIDTDKEQEELVKALAEKERDYTEDNIDF